MSSETKELEALAKVMKKHKIEEYQTVNGAVIKLSPLAMIDKTTKKALQEVEKVDENDLYFSATNFKPKKA